MDPITTSLHIFTCVPEKLDGASKMASSEFTTEWNTLVPQQQCFVITSETTETESISHQGTLSLIFDTNNDTLKY